MFRQTIVYEEPANIEQQTVQLITVELDANNQTTDYDDNQQQRQHQQSPDHLVYLPIPAGYTAEQCVYDDGEEKTVVEGVTESTVNNCQTNKLVLVKTEGVDKIQTGWWLVDVDPSPIVVVLEQTGELIKEFCYHSCGAIDGLLSGK